MFIYFTITTIISAVGLVVGQPILPSYAPRYQLVYLTPSYRINPYQPQQIYQQPILHNRVSGDAGSVEENSIETSSLEEENLEVSQFYSEDAKGRIVFGFHSPDQARMETRDSDGSVRGSYSYIDANGNLVKMQYWDDGNGFHAAGNNLPVAIHQQPEYTPEVKEARENHLRLYEAALESLKAATLNEQNEKDENGYMDTSQYEGGDEYEEHDAPPEEGGVIIENPAPPSSVYADSISAENPKAQLPQSDNNYQVLEEEDDDDSVVIENPAFRQQSSRRKGKSEVKHIPAIKQIGNIPVNGGNQPSLNDQTPFSSRSDNMFPNQPINEQNTKINNGNRAFYYHFTHTIPMPVERVDNSEEAKNDGRHLSGRAQQADNVRIAAVHDPQMSPLQHNTLPSYSFRSQPYGNLPIGGVHDAQVSPFQHNSLPIYSVRTQPLGNIHISAVHDPQISVLQRKNDQNLQLYPVYQPERN